MPHLLTPNTQQRFNTSDSPAYYFAVMSSLQEFLVLHLKIVRIKGCAWGSHDEKLGLGKKSFSWPYGYLLSIRFPTSDLGARFWQICIPDNNVFLVCDYFSWRRLQLHHHQLQDNRQHHLLRRSLQFFRLKRNHPLMWCVLVFNPLVM